MFSHGSDTDFRLDDSGGVLTDISSACDNVSFPRVRDSHETTTFKKDSKTYLSGLKGATISVSGKYDPTADAVLEAAYDDGGEKSFQYGPAGEATGAKKYTGECICTSYEVQSPVGDVATFSAEFQVTGDVAVGTYV